MLLLIARAPPVVWCVMSVCVCVCVCMCMVGDTKRVYRRMHYHMALRIAARSLSHCLPPLRCEAKEPQRMSPRLDIFAANTISCSSVSLMIRSLAFARCMPGETRRYSTVNHRGGGAEGRRRWLGWLGTNTTSNVTHTHTHTHTPFDGSEYYSTHCGTGNDVYTQAQSLLATRIHTPLQATTSH